MLPYKSAADEDDDYVVDGRDPEGLLLFYCYCNCNCYNFTQKVKKERTTTKRTLKKMLSTSTQKTLCYGGEEHLTRSLSLLVLLLLMKRSK